MAINEKWIPIIGEGLSWIKDQLGPSKKQLSVEISDLKKEIEHLTTERKQSVDSVEYIMKAILTKLGGNSTYVVNANNITFIGTNTGTNNVTSLTDTIIDNSVSQIDENVVNYSVSNIFDGIDEEIARTRIHKPSDRR